MVAENTEVSTGFLRENGSPLFSAGISHPSPRRQAEGCRMSLEMRGAVGDWTLTALTPPQPWGECVGDKGEPGFPVESAMNHTLGNYAHNI